MKNKPINKDWEERFDNAFAMGEWFFNGNAGDDYSEFLVWCKKLIRKEIKQQKQELREKIEKRRKIRDGMVVYDKTYKRSSRLCWTNEILEGYNQAISDILKLF